MEEYNDSTFETLLLKTEEYVKTSFELIKLKTLNEILKVVSAIISRTTALLFIFMFFLTASLAVAILIGDSLGKMWLGFIIIAGLYGIIATVITLFLNRWFKTVVSNFILNQIMK